MSLSGEKEIRLNIPFLDLKRQHAALKAEIIEAISRVIDDTAFSGGPFVEEFEREFAAYCGASYVAAVGNGTDALHLAMRALGIGQGDEVIVPANTFVATAWGASHAGATPVFVDCHPETWTIDPARIEERVTARTKAIAGVHLYGQPFDVAAVKEIAARHSLFLIEDCAQAVGAKYRGKRVGGLGDAGCFSFYPGKNLGACGEAGGVTTNSAGLDARIRSLRSHGSLVKYYHDEVGYNMRMDGIHGAVLSLKLKYIDAWNGRRLDIARRYREELASSGLRMQKTPEWAGHVYHLFVVVADDRERLRKHLESKGVFPGIHYPVPCHLQKAYSHLGYRKGDFPNAEALSEGCLSLPVFPEMTDEEVEYVIKMVNTF
ncbi:perosamine synthetase [uncultured bacterium]|nr:perosamine synthetase [uncultured bacterium]